MSKIKEILTLKIRPLYLYSGILILLLIAFFLINLKHFGLSDPEPLQLSTSVTQKPVSSPATIKKDEEPFVFSRVFAEGYSFTGLNKIRRLKSGNFLVVDRIAPKIIEFTPDEELIREWEPLNFEDVYSDIAVDSDLNVYVVIHRWKTEFQIRKYDAEGTPLKMWDEFKAEELYTGIAKMRVTSIAIDSNNYIYADDHKLQCMLKFDSEGNLIKRWGTAGKGPGQFNFSQSSIHGSRIAIDNMDNIYVIDGLNYRVQKFDSEGNFILEFGGRGSANGQLNSPSGVTIGPDKNIYVVDSSGNNQGGIQVFSPGGEWLWKWESKEKGDARFSLPLDLAFDNEGKAYVVSAKKIQVFIPLSEKEKEMGTSTSAKLTFEKEYRYRPSKADSKISRRIITKELVKRLLLEEIGTYLHARPEVRALGITKDYITMLTAGLITAEISGEEWDGKEYYIKAEIIADPDTLSSSIKTLNNDTIRSHWIEKERNKADEAVKKLKELRGKLISVGIAANSEILKQYNKQVKVLSSTDWIEKALFYQIKDKQEEAIDAYTGAIKSYPDNVDAYIQRGAVYSSIGNYQQAERDLQKAIELSPQNVEAHRHLGNVLKKLGKSSLAESSFKKIAEINMRSGQDFFDRGIVNISLGKYKDAVSDFSTALMLVSERADIYQKRGSALYLSGSYEDAIEDFTKAIELNTELTDAYIERGLSHIQLENHHLAIKDFTKTIELEPESEQAYYQRGVSYSYLNQNHEAANDFHRAIKINPEFVQAYIHLGITLGHQNSTQGAIRMFNKAIELDPSSALPYYHRAHLFIKTDKHKQAIKDFTTSIELNPLYIEAYYDRGNLYYSLNDYDQAIRDFDEVIKIDPENLSAYLARGNAYKKKGDPEKAASDLFKARQKSPDIKIQIPKSGAEIEL